MMNSPNKRVDPERSAALKGNQNARKSSGAPAPQIQGGFSKSYLAGKAAEASAAKAERDAKASQLATEFLKKQNPLKTAAAAGLAAGVKAIGHTVALVKGAPNDMTKMPFSQLTAGISEVALGSRSTDMKAGRDMKALNDKQKAADAAYARALSKS